MADPINRPKLNPLLQAVVNLLEAITLGGGTMPVGRNEAPKCDPPYLIVSGGTQASFTGPFGDGDADSSDRIQITAIGISDEQSIMAMDEARTALTFKALTAEGVADRKILSVDLDVSPAGFTEQRGLPEPLFSNADQYLIATTPG